MRRIKQYIIPIYIVICLFMSVFIYLTIKIDDLDRGKIKIGVTYMTMNNTFYQAITNEIQKVVNEKNDILYLRDPALNETKQIEQIHDFIHLKVNYIIINPVNSKTIVPSLKKAKEQGIKIVVVDSPLSDEDVADCTIVSDNYDAGVQCAKDMMNHFSKANIVLLEHNSVISAVD
ncbi:MAG: substrate-binding domain-containing protein, partial [Faecalibacillus sp.]